MANYNEEQSQINISQDELDKLVAEVMRYVLFKTHQNLGCPIKREELTQLITKNYSQRSLPALVINKAGEKLQSIFGYELKELQRSHSRSRQSRATRQPSADQKSYILISNLPSDIFSNYVDDNNTSHIMGFTFVVLGIIHLSGGKVSEENIWYHLKRLGLNENDDNHPVFGNNKQALEALVQQRYLQKEKVEGPNGNIVMYEFAEKALDDSVFEKVKGYVSQITNRDAGVEEA